MAKKSKFADWPGVIERKKPSGNKLYYRFKAGGEKVLPGDIDSEEFAAAYEGFRLLDITPDVAPAKVREYTFDDAWAVYKASDVFTGLDAKTRSRHTYYATTFLDAPVGNGQFKDVPMASPETVLLPLLRTYIKQAKADLPYRTAGILRKLFAVAVNENWCLRNLGNDLDVSKPKTKAGRKQWTPVMLARFETFHQSNPMALAAYWLARGLGNRRGDVALLTWAHLVEQVGGEWAFQFTQQKNQNRTGGAAMFLPVPDQLKAVLQLPALVASRAAGGAIVKSEWGQGFTVNSLGNKFADWCRAAGIPAGYTLHGLRANFADELADAGLDLYALSDAMGHGSPVTTTIYLKGRNRQNAAQKIREARAQTQAQVIPFKGRA